MRNERASSMVELCRVWACVNVCVQCSAVPVKGRRLRKQADEWGRQGVILACNAEAQEHMQQCDLSKGEGGTRQEKA